jgi:Acyl-CoA thioester hydrolase/BAAT N-terminal region
MSTFLLSCYLATALLTQSSHLSITQPSGETIDREIHIQVEHLEPFQEIELQTEAKDQKGGVWSSHAAFRADEKGFIDVTSSSPLGHSSYEGIDGMGLFWSMLPISGDTSSSFKSKNDEIHVAVKLYITGNLSEQQTVVRYLKSPDIKRLDVKENGLVGALFIP